MTEQSENMPPDAELLEYEIRTSGHAIILLAEDDTPVRLLVGREYRHGSFPVDQGVCTA